MIFIETPLFTKKVTALLSDEEYHSLQAYLSTRPDAGVMIVGGGGLRKLRWKCRERGKSGGVRVVYYYPGNMKIYMIYLFSKGEQADLSAEQLKALSIYVKGGVL